MQSKSSFNPGNDIFSAGENPRPKSRMRLLLHCCCAPCATYVLEHLSPIYMITVFFYNPNIKPQEEYDKRAEELRKLIALADYPDIEDVIVCEYAPGEFDAVAAPFWHEPEGGERCRVCFTLRLSKVAAAAGVGKFDYFASTLSVSPHKNAGQINQIGSDLAQGVCAGYLVSDFKKRGGFQRSIELSKRYCLYRQTYCGCLPG